MMQKYVTNPTLEISNNLWPSMNLIPATITALESGADGPSSLQLAIDELRLYAQNKNPDTIEAACALLAAMSSQSLIKSENVQQLWLRFSSINRYDTQNWTEAVTNMIAQIQNHPTNNPTISN